jgi:flavodoxin I
MSNTAVFYGSSTGNTETAANIISEKLGAKTFDVSEGPSVELANFKNLIFGSSTWGIGDLQDDWDGFLSDVENADLSGKIVAIFGCGDANSYADSFVDAIGKIYSAVKDKGCKVVGFVDTDGYDYDFSEAEQDGKFVGLPLDEDNESNLTDQRIDAWVEKIKAEF